MLWNTVAGLRGSVGEGARSLPRCFPLRRRSEIITMSRCVFLTGFERGPLLSCYFFSSLQERLLLFLCICKTCPRWRPRWWKGLLALALNEPTPLGARLPGWSWQPWGGQRGGFQVESVTDWCGETKSNQRKREGRTDRGWGRRERRARGAPAACRKGGGLHPLGPGPVSEMGTGTP